MKNLILSSIILLCVTISYAQWQPDARLTNNTATSDISFNNQNAMALNGDTLHIVWSDYRDGHGEIYYKRSVNGGAAWEPDLRLTNNTVTSSSPSIGVNNENIHVVWQENSPSGNKIYYKRSTNGGLNWSSDTLLTSGVSACISVLGPVLQVVCHDNREGNLEIYYKRSLDRGVTWGPDTRLTNNTSSSYYASISASGLVVHCTWYDYRDGNAEIYYKRSTNLGVAWEADTRITNNDSASTSCSQSVSGQNVHIVWDEARDGNNEIYYKRSTDAGISWLTEFRLTNNSFSSNLATISASGQNIHVVWYDNRDGNYEIYYKNSTNGGVLWSADTRLTNNSANSIRPHNAFSTASVYVVWKDNRDGNDEIYFKKNPTGNTTAVINLNSEIPEGFSLSQNYPNPFNPSTKINFNIPQRNNVTVKVYNSLGMEVSRLVNEALEAGNYSVDFDGSKLASGVYFYQITSWEPSLRSGQGFTDTKKMILTK